MTLSLKDIQRRGGFTTAQARILRELLSQDDLEESLYDKSYRFEKVPGSDVKATTYGVLPLAFHTSGGRPVWAGLVTIDHALTADEANASVPGFQGMAVLAADTPLTRDGYDNGVFPAAGSPAGVYVAMADISNISGGQPPYAFPEGWTAGNTTGQGPVLPLVRIDGVDQYAGLVTVESVSADFLSGATPWTLQALPAADGFVGLDGNVTYPYLYPTSNLPTTFFATYSATTGDPAPTAFPTGWSFQPYGLGQKSPTSGGIAAVIGDVVHLVSGQNDRAYLDTVEMDNWTTYTPATPAGLVSVTAGGRFAVVLKRGETISFGMGSAGNLTSGPQIGDAVWLFNVTHSGSINITTTEGGSSISLTLTGGATVAGAGPNWDWPFLERFNLKTGEWLPRIPMPTREGQLWSGDGLIGGLIKGKIYFGGAGGTNKTPFTGQEWWVYDPKDESFTQLADAPTDTDWVPYGVFKDKLYCFTWNEETYVYDPATDTWTLLEYDASPIIDTIGDSVQGLVVGDKMWFIYQQNIISFNPTTGEFWQSDKQTPGRGQAWLLDGQIFVSTSYQGRGYGPDHDIWAFSYDPKTDTLTERPDVAVGTKTDMPSGYSAVVYKGVPYLVSYPSVYNAAQNYNVPQYGFLAMTGVDLDEPRASRQEDKLLTALKASSGGVMVRLTFNTGLALDLHLRYGDPVSAYGQLTFTDETFFNGATVFSALPVKLTNFYISLVHPTEGYRSWKSEESLSGGIDSDGLFTQTQGTAAMPAGVYRVIVTGSAKPIAD